MRKRPRTPTYRTPRLSVEFLEDRSNPSGFADPFAVNLSVVATPADRINVVTAAGGETAATLAALSAAPFADAVEHVGFGIYNVTLDTGVATGEAITYYGGLPGVTAAEPDYVVQVERTPNDPGYAQLYAMSKISAPTAWDTTTGSGNFVVAVIDSGVDYNHPDLIANMWRNPAEVNGDGLDNDGNGLVDDYYGANFVGTNTGNPFDDNGHGTHVAGTIGAVGNNGVGVAGVNWGVKIMALKFLSAAGNGSTSDAVEALNYAVANGAKVSNNSWGGGGYSQTLFNAIQAAQAKGHVFVAAAGNDNTNIDTSPRYPASFNLANVVAVASTTSTDARSGFSNYGATTVDIAAPGSGIVSTTPNNTYGNFSGTSMASPHVAGAIALYWDANPTATATQVIDRLKATADTVAELTSVAQGGKRLNVGALIGVPPPPASPPPPAPPATGAGFADDFSAATPSSAWSFVGGGWVQSGGVLRQTSTADGDPFKAIVGGRAWAAAQEVTASVRVDSWSGGLYPRAGVGVRTNAAGEGYNLVFRSGNQVQFLNDGVAWGNAYTFNWQTGVWYTFRLRAEADGTLRGKVWAAGQTEPANWMFAQSGWSGRTGGSPALNGSSNRDGGAATVSFDDVSAADVAPAAPLFADDFSAATLGGAWTTYGGTWAVSNGTVGQTSSAAAPEKKAVVTGLADGAANEIAARVRVDAWTSGPYARAGVGIGTDAAGLGYNIVFRDNNTVQFLNDRVAWGNAYAFDWQVGASYQFRLRQDADGTLRAKVWAAGQAEPAGWMFTQAGWGYRAGRAALNGGSAVTGLGTNTASFDDVKVWA